MDITSFMSRKDVCDLAPGRPVQDVLSKMKNCVSNDCVHCAAVVAEARSVCGRLMERAVMQVDTDEHAAATVDDSQLHELDAHVITAGLAMSHIHTFSGPFPGLPR